MGTVARWVEDGGLVVVTAIGRATLLRVAGGPPILALPAALSPAEQEAEGTRLLWCALSDICHPHHGAVFAVIAALAALFAAFLPSLASAITAATVVTASM